ncbi:hypothetical protein [Brevibacillus dissolubilis]|uniref:hypothetical protein n=1 Tax=Brevibacillus dissolubilis TaxID=1844116 RepID=UPI00111700F4|nr:hypothetical protein [Brevibacillus dissolubilis]
MDKHVKWGLMKEYFDNVTVEQLIEDSKRAGMIFGPSEPYLPKPIKARIRQGLRPKRITAIWFEGKPLYYAKKHPWEKQKHTSPQNPT